jgi:hypothetical protein
MSQSSFSRYIVGRLSRRIAATKSGSMRTFVLLGAAGGEISTVRILLASVLAFVLLVARIAKAVFDSLFEAIGLLLGRPLFALPHVVRVLVGLSGAAGFFYLLWGQTWWFVAPCLALIAIDLYAATNNTPAAKCACC